MKTLNQILEGTVEMSDYKLDKKGRKYKAHRMSMGDDMKESTNPHKLTTKKNMGEAADQEVMNKERSRVLAKFIKGATPKNGQIVNNIDTSGEVTESIEQVDELKKSTLRSYLKKAVPSHGDEEFISRVSKDPEEKAISKRIAGNRAVGIIRANKGLKSAHVATMKEDVEGMLEGSDISYHQTSGTKATHNISSKKLSSEPQASNSDVTLQSGSTKHHGKSYNFPKGTMFKSLPGGIFAKHPSVPETHPGYGHLIRSTEANINKIHSVLKKQDMKENVNPYYDLDEARGRPAGAATLAKRAAAAAKPREDDDEGEHYDKDSGVEADQHIHVQLKKAADSDQKPFEVSFKNGKKHTVSQKVAKDVLSATERLKPEHRKNVHDEIHQSYDNLMSVHRLVARK